MALESTSRLASYSGSPYLDRKRSRLTSGSSGRRALISSTQLLLKTSGGQSGSGKAGGSVAYSLVPLGRMLILASHLKLPSSILPVDTPRYCRIVRSFIRYCLASSGELISGSLTISINGTPERLTSPKL